MRKHECRILKVICDQTYVLQMTFGILCYGNTHNNFFLIIFAFREERNDIFCPFHSNLRLELISPWLSYEEIIYEP